MVLKAEQVTVAISSVRGASVVQGSGLVYTSDGLIVTLASLVPAGYTPTIYFGNGDDPIEKVQIVKRDGKKNLALLKIERNGLETIGLVNAESLVLGEKVIFVAKKIGKDGVSTIANEGIIKIVNGQQVRTNIFENSTMAGGVLLDIRGRVIGLGLVNGDGIVETILPEDLREFLGS